MSETVSIRVQTTKKIKALTHQVLAGGKILESKLENFSETDVHYLRIKPSIFMLPKATVVIYYVADNGEIVSDRINVEFGNQLLNHVRFFPP